MAKALEYLRLKTYNHKGGDLFRGEEHNKLSIQEDTIHNQHTNISNMLDEKCKLRARN